MKDKLERLFNIAMVNIELMEQEVNNGKVQSEAGRYAPEDSGQVQDDSGQVAENEQYLLGLAGTGDRGSAEQPAENTASIPVP